MVSCTEQEDGKLAAKYLAITGSVVCLELIAHLEEDNANMALHRNKPMREPLRQAVQIMADLAERRIDLGETNVRGHMFYCMVSGKCSLWGQYRGPGCVINPA